MKKIIKNPLLIILLLIVLLIIILFVYNYFVNTKRKNISERFSTKTSSTCAAFVASIQNCKNVHLLNHCKTEKCNSCGDVCKECNDKLGKKMIDSKCICTIKNTNEKFVQSKESCLDFNSLTDCQKDLCKGDNFTPNMKNCTDIRFNLTKDNQKSCCDNFYSSISDDYKSRCLEDINPKDPATIEKYCIPSNQKYKYFNGTCCKSLPASKKKDFCKAECQAMKTKCDDTTIYKTDANKKTCMNTYYNAKNLDCKTYDT